MYSKSMSNTSEMTLFAKTVLGQVQEFFNSKKLFSNTFKCWFEAFIVAFDWYLFQLVTFLKPDFNCCNSIELS